MGGVLREGEEVGCDSMILSGAGTVGACRCSPCLAAGRPAPWSVDAASDHDDNGIVDQILLHFSASTILATAAVNAGGDHDVVSIIEF